MAPTPWILLLFVCLFSLSEAKKPRGRNTPPQEGLTPQYLYARIRAVERKLSRSQREMTKTQAIVKDLAGRIGQGGGGGVQNAPAAATRQKFSSLGPCPLGVEGFYYAPQFRSCYKLEARDLLINFTEATRTCHQQSPKADLVSIESEAEQEFLEDRWQAELGIGSLVRYWTSARRNNNGKWSWEAINRPLTYNKWVPSTEHNDDRFSCMSVFSNEAYNWGDVACWAAALVMCEINI